MAKISMHITVETEERTDRWACSVPEFGFTVYGETRAEAREEVNNALNALMASFYGDLDGIAGFLEHRGVKHVIQRDSEPDYHTRVIEMSHAEVLIA